MTEQEIEELLGAYALDAIEPAERAEVEAHLAICPQCRAEVAAHREVAALMANSSIAVPEGLWDRIAGELSPELPEPMLDSKHLIAHLPNNEHLRKRSPAFIGAMIAAAAVIIVIALLSVQVANLSRQVHTGGSTPSGIAAAVQSVLSHQHRSVVLTSTNKKFDATVAVGPNGDAYWVSSNLALLGRSKTYQLWTIVRGTTVVSLGVLGPNPKTATGFRLEPDMRRLMVTIEPEGGTPQPTSPVLVSAAI